jgi:hypothetical protein
LRQQATVRRELVQRFNVQTFNVSENNSFKKFKPFNRFALRLAARFKGSTSDLTEAEAYGLSFAAENEANTFLWEETVEGTVR